MNTALAWDNVVAYSLQIGLLVGVASLIPALLRLRLPKARLAYWHLLLAACLLLPQTRPWKRAVVTVTTPVAAPRAIAVAPVAPIPRTGTHWTPGEIGLLVLAAGALGRLGWLALGLWKLRRYRRNSTPWRGPAVAFGPRPEFRISGDIGSPVTFGLRSPVVLLPRNFEELPVAMQEAVLCHEALHVERHDWAFTVGEELVRAVFWFHPAIWWLLGEIQLAREQAVDREVVERTERRDEYVDALLAVAGARMQPDLAPAPLFLRKRHLKQRVIAVVKEIRMSRMRSISTLTVGLVLLAAASWFVTAAFPLAAEPQIVADGAGITVELNGAQLLHRTPVRYPAEAAAKGVEGTVAAQVRLDASGAVMDANIVSGPDELRKAVLESVLNWHFTKDSAGGTRTVTVSFQLPAQAQAPAASHEISPQFRAEVAAQGAEAAMAAATGSGQERAASAIAGMNSSHIVKIDVRGLSDQARSDLLAALPVHVGDACSYETVARITAAARAFDKHLRVSWQTHNGETTLDIATPDTPAISGAPGTVTLSQSGASPVPLEGAPQRIQVGGNVQASLLVYGPKPEYPDLARAAGISGVVHLHAFIGKDGAVQSLTVVPPAHPLLAPAAVEAVRQWRYKPTLLNGQPVEVETTIDVSFALAGQPTDPQDSPPPQVGQPGLSPLGLRVEYSGRDLLLTWNRDSYGAKNGQQGVLQVFDGDSHQSYEIDRQQLTSGLGVLYSPQTRDVSFRMSITDGKGVEIGTGSLRVVHPPVGGR
jgi:TonB family protein